MSRLVAAIVLDVSRRLEFSKLEKSIYNHRLDNLKMFWAEVIFRVSGWHQSSEYYFCYSNIIVSGVQIFVLICSVASLVWHFSICGLHSWTSHRLWS